MSDEASKFVAIDEEAHDQIMHGGRFGKANCPAYKALDPRPQIDMFALDFLGVLLADHVLLRGEMPLVGTPSIRIKPCDVKRRQERLQLEKDVILPSSKDIRQHRPAVMINRMPQPPWLGFLAHKTPHLIQL